MGRSRSRSHSPRRRHDRERRDRERDRERERDRRRRRSRERDRRRSSPDRHRPKSRSRSRSREGERSRDREREKIAGRLDDLQKKRKKAEKDAIFIQQRPIIAEVELQGKTDEEKEMMRTMGFGTFDTTKGKKVAGNNQGEVHVILKRKYRQYMNRKGGFNRPLDFVA